jgi:hypothetical protein
MATLNSSNITDGNTIEPTDILQLYDAFTSGGGTTGAYNVTVSGSLIGNASTATSASYAVTASYALNGGGGTVTQISNQAYTRAGTGPVESNFKFVAGYLKLSGGTASTPNFPQLAGKALGVNAFVTATIQASSATSGNVVAIKDISVNGSITVVTAGGTGNEDVNFTCMYVAS